MASNEQLLAPWTRLRLRLRLVSFECFAISATSAKPSWSQNKDYNYQDYSEYPQEATETKDPQEKISREPQEEWDPKEAADEEKNIDFNINQ